MYDLIIYGLIYALIGAFSGLMAGILGLGGGMVVVPGLLFVFNYNHFIPASLSMHFAVGTSLATMIFTANAAVKAHYDRGQILWHLFAQLWLGLSIGAFLGVILARFLPADSLQILFGLFLLFVAYKLYTDVGFKQKSTSPKLWVDRLVSIVIGFLSGLLGVGGGTMIIPYLLYKGVPIRQTAAVSALCTMTVALTGTLAMILIGSHVDNGPSYSTGYIYWPAVIAIVIPSYFFAPLGVKLTYTLPVNYLKYVFISMMLLVSFSLLFA